MSFKVKLTEPVIDLSWDENFIIEDAVTTMKIMQAKRDIEQVLRMEGKTDDEIKKIMAEIKIEIDCPEDKRFLIH